MKASDLLAECLEGRGHRMKASDLLAECLEEEGIE